MFKKLWIFLAAVLMLALMVTAITASAATDTEEKPTLNISVVTTKSSNDLVKTLNSNYNGITVYSTLDEALNNVTANGTKGIMVLADNYPNSTTVISDEQAARINSLGVRLYVEYPTNNDSLGITGWGEIASDLSGSGKMNYDRAIVTDSANMGMDIYSILYVHGARYAKKSDISRAWMVNATVVGYDTVEFYDETTGELTDCTPYSLLETNEAGNALICSTKFSQFITGRYAPYERWQKVWLSILSFVSQSEVTSISWTPLVNPNYGPEEELADDAYSEAVRLNVEWYLKSTIMDPNNDGVADGTEGVMEGLRSGSNINDWGKMYRNGNYRADCNGESAGAIALAGALLNNEEYKTVAKNIIDTLYANILLNGDRADSSKDEYGLLGWHTGVDYAQDYYYGDDNAKAILGLILGAAALETEEYDERILEAIIANFRTTGVNGFRGAMLNGEEIETNGWEYYYTRENYTNYQSHFESLLWGCYLWAYEQTGYEPFLERTKTAIGLMMDSYEKTMTENDGNDGEWYWTNGMQQERAKMILCLAWLARIEPTDEHIGWLDTMISDMMAYSPENIPGAIREVIGGSTEGRPVYTQFSTNSDYGKHESPVIQNNGDPCTDSLYTSSFAMMTLNEAFAAMEAIGNTSLATKYQTYARAVSDYHVRIQQVSSDAYYNGVWFRGFDYEKWETYGSDGDAGWGIWCAETGWCQAWISATLSLQQMGTNIWDYSKTSTVQNYFPATASLMLESYYVVETNVTVEQTLGRGTASQLIDGIYGSTNNWNDGKWFGAEGSDLTFVADYGIKKTFNTASVDFFLQMSSGICPPASVTFLVSNDGINFTEMGTWVNPLTPQQTYDNNVSDLAATDVVTASFTSEAFQSARYVKVEIKNAGTFVKSDTSETTAYKTWIFLDELTLSIDGVTHEDLKALIDEASAKDTAGYQPATVLAFNEAYVAAVEYYNDATYDETKRQGIYNNLYNAMNGLVKETSYTVISSTNISSGQNNLDKLTDGLEYNKSYVQGKIITNLSTLEEQSIEFVLDLGSTTSVISIGYIAQTSPTYGVYLHDAEFFVSDSADGPWASVGTVYGEVPEFIPFMGSNGNYGCKPLYAEANGTEGRYVKVIFTRNADIETRVNGELKRAEWLFLDEILINEYCEIDVTTENVTANLTDENGNAPSVLGAVMGQDITVTLVPNENCYLSSVTLNGEEITVENNSFVIRDILTAQNIVATYVEIAPEDLPVLNVKDLFFATGTTPNLLLDVTAYDKTGADITENVTVISDNVGTAAGTYTVTYRVTDDYGASIQETVNVHLVSGLSGKHVVAATHLSDRLANHGTNIQKLVNGSFPAEGTNCWDSNNVYWQNESAIEIVIAIGEEIGIADLGYSLLSNPSMGIISPDVELYYANEVGVWTYAGTIEATYHAHEDLSTYEYVKRTMALKDVKASYVKAIIKFDDDPEIRARYIEDCKKFTGKGAQEWTFANEIIINPYYSISANEVVAEAGSVEISTDHADGSLYGESAVVTVTPAAGYFIESVTVNGVPVSLTNNTYTITNITEHHAVVVTITKYVIQSAAVKLSESISLIYYAVLDSDSLSDAEMLFTLNDTTTAVSGVATKNANIYAFEFCDIAPQCMGDTVTAVFTVNGNTVDTLENYSIKAYCDATLESIAAKSIEGYTDAQYTALKALITDMLEYGAKAQVYKSHKTDSLVNDGIDGAREFTALTEEHNATVSTSASDNVYLVSGGVRFDYVNYMYFKFNATGISEDEVLIKITSALTGTVQEYTLADCNTTDTDDVYILYSQALAPTDYDERFTVELYEGGTVVQTLEYSASAYVYYCQNRTDTNGDLTKMAELARAMYNFGLSAVEYKAAI